jgi:Ni,Fe-hydrogenase III small subunit
MIRVYRINTGSCGGCDVEIEAAVDLGTDLGWADGPYVADVLLLTGPLTAASQPAFRALWAEMAGRTPLLAIGRCAIDGYPFGHGGLAELPEINARKLDGCPPTPAAIVEAIRQACRRPKAPTA